MPRLITISNRLPISIVLDENNEYAYTPSAGGLATGLSSFHSQNENLWVGWPGMEILDEKKEEVTVRMKKDNMLPVFLTEQDIEDYYEGFSNKTIWPLYHYFKLYAEYNPQYWEAYKKVNRQFADEVIKVARPDDIFWVHDYQLMLVPEMLREEFPEATIGFFLHIPFPSYELYRSLPWRHEILCGLLGADLIGFHTYDYARHFLSSVKRLRGHNHTLGRISLYDRVADVDSFPMGIDFEKFNKAIYEPETIEEVINFRNNYGDVRLILSIDRLDYSKGILQRIEAFDRFLQDYPEYIGKVSLITVLVPSRANVEQYKLLKEQIDEAVGRINGKYNTLEWTAILYFYRSLPFHTLAALYYASEISLITPFRDGMNLIAKEYVATKVDKKGMLILSEMAGAAEALTEAIHINPNDIDNIKEAIHEAINMPEEEKIWRMSAMQDKIARYDVKQWAELFIKRLKEASNANKRKRAKYWSSKIEAQLLEDYTQASSRLLMLDYDGTLVGFHKDPLQARPDKELLEILSDLCADARNHVVVISGRDSSFLDKWLGHLPVEMVAEHGVWVKDKEGKWSTTIEPELSWKEEIRDVMESFVERTSGSFIEEKKYSLAWHYRQVNAGLGETRAHEMVDLLTHRTSDLNLQILEGSKVIEVKTSGINKGKATQRWLESNNWGFIAAIGDDFTDEDTFRAMNPDAYTIKVGYNDSVARFHIAGVSEVRKVLRKLASQDKPQTNPRIADAKSNVKS
jgi:trehalose 6-phosphate synthase/phosphatase